MRWVTLYVSLTSLPYSLPRCDVLLSGFDGERRAGGWVDPLLRHTQGAFKVSSIESNSSP